MSPPKPLGTSSFPYAFSRLPICEPKNDFPMVRYAPALLVSASSQTFRRCGLLDGDTLLRRRSDAQTRNLRGIRCRSLRKRFDRVTGPDRFP